MHGAESPITVRAPFLAPKLQESRQDSELTILRGLWPLWGRKVVLLDVKDLGLFEGAFLLFNLPLMTLFSSKVQIRASRIGLRGIRGLDQGWTLESGLPNTSSICAPFSEDPRNSLHFCQEEPNPFPVASFPVANLSVWQRMTLSAEDSSPLDLLESLLFVLD